VTFVIRLAMLSELFQIFRSINSARASARLTKEDHMKKLLSTTMSLLLLSSIAFAANAAQTSNTNTNANSATTPAKKRGPVFRANKDQIKQAQAIVKERGFYTGEQPESSMRTRARV
jgi:hypothetical protein